jgi:hypothetical protein
MENMLKPPADPVTAKPPALLPVPSDPKQAMHERLRSFTQAANHQLTGVDIKAKRCEVLRQLVQNLQPEDEAIASLEQKSLLDETHQCQQWLADSDEHIQAIQNAASINDKGKLQEACAKFDDFDRARSSQNGLIQPICSLLREPSATLVSVASPGQPAADITPVESSTVEVPVENPAQSINRAESANGNPAIWLRVRNQDAGNLCKIQQVDGLISSHIQDMKLDLLDEAYTWKVELKARQRGENYCNLSICESYGMSMACQASVNISAGNSGDVVVKNIICAKEEGTPTKTYAEATKEVFATRLVDFIRECASAHPPAKCVRKRSCD